MATRLILTSLPFTLTQAGLQSFLQRSLPDTPATDVSVPTTREGKSRRLAFIGFASHESAESARKWLDGAWVEGDKGRGGGRVRADWAKETAALPAHANRKRPSSSALPPAKREKPSTATSAAAPAVAADARFDEFMAVMGSRSSKRAPTKAEREAEHEVLVKQDQRVPEEMKEDDPEADENAAVLAANKAKASSSRKALNAAMGLEDEGSEEEGEDEDVRSSDSEDEARGKKRERGVDDGVAEDEEVDDMEYMRRRFRRDLAPEAAAEGVADEEAGASDSDSEEDEAVADTKEETAAPANKPQSKEEETRSLISATSRLFLRNLPYSATASSLSELFESYSPSEVHLPLTPSGQNKGYAHVSFASPEEAVRAWEELDGKSWMGRLLHLLPGAEGRDNKKGEEEGGTVKERKERERKKMSEKGLDWGTFYMNTDAVLNSISARLSLSKADLLSSSSSTSGASVNPAVRVALAEASVIQETKTWLSSQGVNLDAFTPSDSTGKQPPRDRKTLLLKNMPYSFSLAQLQAILDPLGKVDKVLLPPAGTIAVVKFEKEEEARKAFGGLSYRKVGDGVLFVEKAPGGIWDGAAAPPAKEKAEAEPSAKENKVVAAAAEEDGEQKPGTTLFIKNLNFATTSASLTGAFQHLPQFKYAKVQLKPDPLRRTTGGTLSMGFGFAGFGDEASARHAKEQMDGRTVEGHKLLVSFAKRGNEASASAAAAKDGPGKVNSSSKKGGTSTKLLVKNLPFEATKADVRSLFSTYGTLKSVRLPHKMDRKSRGFAFVEFGTRADAESAKEGLEHVHLLGRHLVMQWAEEGEGKVE